VDRRSGMDLRSLMERRNYKGQRLDTDWSGRKERRREGDRRTGNERRLANL
jgi:hypothetical protein